MGSGGFLVIKFTKKTGMNNILFINPNPVWGGAATANLAIAKMLINNGYNVVFNDEYYPEEYYNGIKIDHTPIHQKKFADRSLLKRLIDDHGIDCVIWSPLAAVYFYQEIRQLKKQGIKQIAIVHSLSLTKDFKGKIMDFLVSITLAQMSTIVFVSEYTMKSWNKFRAIKKSKATKKVIHNIVDIQANNHSLNQWKPTIGFVGRLSEEKQPKLFCELANKCDYKFIVFGDGPLMTSLKEQYDRIDFRGQCSNTSLIYSEIDVLVMTSRFENCPMVILEAQAYGIPCVAPAVGGIPELIESGVDGILYNDYSMESISNAISTIISKYTLFSSNSIRSSKIHTPRNAISKWKEILN